jgi:hypothetical protein
VLAAAPAAAIGLDEGLEEGSLACKSDGRRAIKFFLNSSPSGV